MVEPPKRQAGDQGRLGRRAGRQAEGAGSGANEDVWFWSSMTAAQVKDATLATVTAAAQLGEVHVLVAGTGVGGSRRCGGEDRRRAARSMSPMRAHLEHQLAEDVAPVAAKLMDGHDAFLAPATTFGKNVAPRVAALLDVMQVSDIIGVEDDSTFVRPIYAGNAIATVRSRIQEGHHRSRHGVREGGARAAARARSRRSTPAAHSGKSASSAPRLSKSERPELTSAKVIVSGGRAFGSNDQFHGSARPARRQARRRGRRSRAPRSTPAMRPTIIRSARPARSSPPKSISRSAFPARSSTLPG